MKLLALGLASVALASLASFLDRRSAERHRIVQPPPRPSVDDGGDPRLHCHAIEGGYACTRRDEP